MKYYCNPINVDYRYQFNKDPRVGVLQIGREAADPSMIEYKGRYYIFASMQLAVWVSDDMVHWESHRLPENLPLYDYAPDVRVLGDYVYMCASKHDGVCNRYRTQDVINGPYEEIPGNFPFWDPNMFVDDDGRIYFYWGCNALKPIYGVELDPETLLPIGETKELLWGHPEEFGYERVGDDNSVEPATPEQIEASYQGFLKSRNMTDEMVPAQFKAQIRGMFAKHPYIEGAWMDKHDGKYYLQYAMPGTQYNTYADGVYVSDSPLGEFVPADNNPYSYKPGGFINGAGHGSSMEDKDGNWWHTASMRISQNFMFERRVGIWPAGFDQDGELFCNQEYGDWPRAVSEGRMDPWEGPAWMLQSYGKPANASSFEEGKGPDKAVNEDIRDWWRAATNESGQWVQVDLEKSIDVRAIQVNFADDKLEIAPGGEIRGKEQARYIEEAELKTRYILEGSVDGENYFMIEDKSQAESDLPHDFILREDGIEARYIRLTVISLPYDQIPAVSGLRIWGNDTGEMPEAPAFAAERTEAREMTLTIQPTEGAIGYNVLWGSAPDKLYHSWLLYGAPEGETVKCIRALAADKQYYVKVDAFNTHGITKGSEIVKL